MRREAGNADGEMINQALSFICLEVLWKRKVKEKKVKIQEQVALELINPSLLLAPGRSLAPKELSGSASTFFFDNQSSFSWPAVTKRWIWSCYLTLPPFFFRSQPNHQELAQAALLM